MGRAELNHEWSDLGEDDLLALFDQLAPTLDRSVAKLAKPLEKATQLRAHGAYIQDVSDPRESAERLGSPPTSISVIYGRRVDVGLGLHVIGAEEGPIRNVRLDLHFRQSNDNHSVAVLHVTGEDDHATHGFFGEAVNSLQASAQRLKVDESRISATMTPPGVPGARAVPGARGRLQRWLTHPTVATIVGGVTVAAILAIVGWVAAHHL